MRLKAGIAYISTGLGILLGFALLYTVSNTSGIDVYGQFIILKSTAGFLGGVLSVRSGEAVTKFAVREETFGHLGRSKAVTILGLVVDIAVSLLIVLFFFLTGDLVVQHLLQQPNLLETYYMFALTSFFAYLRGALIGFLEAVDKTISINILVGLESGFLLAWCGYVLVADVSIDLKDLVLIHVIVYAVISIVFYLIFYIAFSKKFKSVQVNWNSDLLREYLDFSIKTFVSSLMKAANQHVDNLVIATFAAPQSVGIYQGMKKIFSVTQVICHPWTMLSYAKLVSFHSKKMNGEFTRYVLNVTTVLVSITVLTGGVIFLFFDELSSFMGLPLEVGSSLFNALIYISFILSSLVWWARIFSNVVNPFYSLQANFYIFLYQITISIFLISIFGLSGAILSFLGMNLLVTGFWLFKYCKYFSNVNQQ